MTLLEKYSKRIKLAESVYGQTHSNEKLSDSKKLILAKTLDNVNSYLSESFDPATATQRAGMGDYKRFCLALTNLAIPNQIALDLVHSVPMSSFVGNIAYVKFVAGEFKGDTDYMDLINDPFRLGDAKKHVNYTSAQVVSEMVMADPATGEVFDQLRWTPCVKGGFFDEEGNEFDARIIRADGSVEFAEIEHDPKEDSWKVAGLAEGDRVDYRYDNVIIPQKKLPTLVAVMDNIPLQARARRIAVRYSQIAA